MSLKIEQTLFTLTSNFSIDRYLPTISTGQIVRNSGTLPPIKITMMKTELTQNQLNISPLSPLFTTLFTKYYYGITSQKCVKIQI